MLLALLVSLSLTIKINDRSNLQLITLGRNYGDSNVTRTFVLGDSVQQSEEKIQSQIKSQQKLASSLSRGESYTGTGNQIEVIGESNENCVEFSKRITGIDRPLGAGAREGISTGTPQVGAIGAEKKVVHAVVVEKIEGDNITIIEANWYRGKITRRVLKRSDFIGFII